MELNEFLSLMQKHGAHFYAPVPATEIPLVNSALQNMRCAILPHPIINLYQHCGAISMGCGYIYGPIDTPRGTKYPIPGLVSINADLTGISKLRGLTIFGRNDLFWFAFDSFGKFSMLDNITLDILRQYDDAYHAMSDCLVAGKI